MMNIYVQHIEAAIKRKDIQTVRLYLHLALSWANMERDTVWVAACLRALSYARRLR